MPSTKTKPAEKAPKVRGSLVVSTPEEMTEALKGNPTFRPQQIGDILVQEGLVTETQLSNALQIQAEDPKLRLGEILQGQGAATHETIVSTLAEKLGLPFVRLKAFPIDTMCLNRLPVDVARRHQVLPLMEHDRRLVVAMEDPTDQETIHLLRFLAGTSLEIAVATQGELRAAINRHYGDTEEEHAIGDLGLEHEVDHDEDERRAMEQLGSERPIVRLVTNIIREGIKRRASDIHIQPQDGRVDLIYRIDGSLVYIRKLSKALLPAVVSRIKIIGRMNIAERRLPQDGRTRVVEGDNVCDLRMSVIPTSQGESVVIRILNQNQGLLSIDELGFNKRDEEIFRHLVHKSNGLMLVTGPTGSGKSTTLYAGIGEVRKQNVHIITTENPVEYEMDGVQQIAVNTVPGYTFARALRNILRHDPDVIMVGEIRDKETANIAVESSLTGHLVLSTLHTNSAAATVSRMVEMGVEPYLLSSTLIGVLAQRLIRRNCRHCMTTEKVDAQTRKALGVGPREKFYKGEGCDHCNGTGYYGRMVTYELMQVTPELRKLISANGTSGQYQDQAIADGMVPLTEQAIGLARKKYTSLAEVYRVRLN
jgi:type IV pilus assembly protein PilB